MSDEGKARRAELLAADRRRRHDERRGAVNLERDLAVGAERLQGLSREVVSGLNAAMNAAALLNAWLGDHAETQQDVLLRNWGADRDKLVALREWAAGLPGPLYAQALEIFERDFREST